jgi:hypothetical protein
MQVDTAPVLKLQQESSRAFVARFGVESIEEVQEVFEQAKKTGVNTKNRSSSFEVMLSKRPELQFVIQRAKKFFATIILKEPLQLTMFSFFTVHITKYKINLSALTALMIMQ